MSPLLQVVAARRGLSSAACLPLSTTHALSELRAHPPLWVPWSRRIIEMPNINHQPHPSVSRIHPLPFRGYQSHLVRFGSAGALPPERYWPAGTTETEWRLAPLTTRSQDIDKQFHETSQHQSSSGPMLSHTRTHNGNSRKPNALHSVTARRMLLN